VTAEAIKVVVFQEGELWVAQCLDYDFAVSAHVRDQVLARLKFQLRGQMVADRRRGRAPFSGFKRAPARFWTMFDEAVPWQHERLVEPLEARIRAWVGQSGPAAPRELIASQAI
jgi:hypothetical protein